MIILNYYRNSNSIQYIDFELQNFLQDKNKIICHLILIMNDFYIYDKNIDCISYTTFQKLWMYDEFYNSRNKLSLDEWSNNTYKIHCYNKYSKIELDNMINELYNVNNKYYNVSYNYYKQYKNYYKIENIIFLIDYYFRQKINKLLTYGKNIETKIDENYINEYYNSLKDFNEYVKYCNEKYENCIIYDKNDENIIRANKIYDILCEEFMLIVKAINKYI